MASNWCTSLSNSSTAACRSLIAAGSRSGAESQRRRQRAPMVVEVRFTASNSEPAVPAARKVRSTSSDRQVASSIRT